MTAEVQVHTARVYPGRCGTGREEFPDLVPEIISNAEMFDQARIYIEEAPSGVAPEPIVEWCHLFSDHPLSKRAPNERPGPMRAPYSLMLESRFFRAGISWPGVFLYPLTRLPGVTHEHLVDALLDALRQMAAKSAWRMAIEDDA